MTIPGLHRRWCTLIAIAVLVPTLGTHARADLAPPPKSLAHYATVHPRGHDQLPSDYARFGEGTSFELKTYTDLEGADIRLVSETVGIDLYPTFIMVRAELVFTAGPDGVDDLEMGFPESLPSLFWHPRPQLQGFEVRIDGEVINTDHIAFERKKQPLPKRSRERGHPRVVNDMEDFARSPAVERWYVWHVGFPPRATHRVTIHYFHVPRDEAFFGFQYVVAPGALWRGPVGSSDIDVRLHGLAPNEVARAWYPLANAPISPEVGATASSYTEGSDGWSWHFEELEPRESLFLDYAVGSSAPAEECADSSLPPMVELLCLLDRLRRAPDDERSERFSLFLNDLQRLSGHDDVCVRHEANVLLDKIAESCMGPEEPEAFAALVDDDQRNTSGADSEADPTRSGRNKAEKLRRVATLVSGQYEGPPRPMRMLPKHPELRRENERRHLNGDDQLCDDWVRGFARVPTSAEVASCPAFELTPQLKLDSATQQVVWRSFGDFKVKRATTWGVGLVVFAFSFVGLAVGLVWLRRRRRLERTEGNA